MTPKQFVKEYRRLGSMKAVARQHGIYWNKIRAIYLQAVEQGLLGPLSLGAKSREQLKAPEPVVSGTVGVRKTFRWAIPKMGCSRYIFTCAQNNTHVHEPVWQNLLALADHYGAQLYVARFTYIKSGLGASGDKSKWLKRETSLGDPQNLWWDQRLHPHFLDDRVDITPTLTWCGEMNTLPTASRPLSSLDNYTGARSSIIPHVKFAMESVATGKHEPSKFLYTTGAVTLRNYIQRKAGLKAEFHHVYGGLLVEVDSDGDWFVRQLNASEDGTIHDLDLRVHSGRVTTGHRPTAVVWGDAHVASLDRPAAEAAFGDHGILHILRPHQQFLHDLIDFRSRSHHEMKDPHRQFRKHLTGQESVESELEQAGRFLRAVEQRWCRTQVVDSNHHHHIGRWLREQDARLDPVNAEFWLAIQREVYRRIREGKTINYLQIAMRLAGYRGRARFLDEDESYTIDNVEYGIHGHAGPGGSRGTPQNLARLGRKVTSGHTHKAQIIDGMYVVGCLCSLDPDWTSGPSAWSHSHALHYPNGKRAIITSRSHKWRAA